MEREDFEEIPWSHLVAETRDGIDRRWYLAGIGVGLVVAAILGFRLVSGNAAQPSPVAAADHIATTVTVADERGMIEVEQVAQGDPPDSSGQMIVAEADLRALEVGADLGVIMAAEWFVTDLHTVDGSDQGALSLREALAPALRDDPLPHDDASSLGDPGTGATFVEWARAFDMEWTSAGDTVVSVAYRMIRTEGDGFIRDPVRAVSVVMRRINGVLRVVEWPTEVDAPWYVP
ncbi:MAG TPA: hypothetical protein VLA29_11590 [Acidimicrobiia bacterium]|nr:hypothetical protein [Acidimicrobiia bacterium]